MKFHFRLFVILISAIISQSAMALDADFFSAKSKLSSGKWVKISIEENGIYEITYDELREMGFSNPEKVGLYGRGGEIMDENFISAGKKVYYDDISPVAILHKNEKLLFYGQGSSMIRYRSELSNPVNRRFVRQSINTYSDKAYYFLTDSDAQILTITDATGIINESKPEMTECYDYFYHESELKNFCLSGRLFVGESLTDDHSISIPYSIPGAIENESCSVECQFYANNGTGSTLKYGFSNNQIEATINAPNNLYYAAKAFPAYSESTLPSANGTFNVDYTPSGQTSNAHIDYIIIGAKKKIAFQPGQTQFRAFIPNYSTSQYGIVRIENAPKTTIAWDIKSPSDIKNLPLRVEENIAKVKFLTPYKTSGLMIAFDPEQTQMKISDYKIIDNQNLHSIKSDEVPDMLIITVPYLHDKAEELADIHRQYDNMDILVINSEDIINEFSGGTPDAMAYRAFCKMLYDRNPQKFKNLLLFGEMHYDNRQISSLSKRELLISYQTEESLHADMTFCISDFYGMLEDTPSSKGMQYDTINIGVGELPCRSINDADIVINKIAQYTVDTSFANWLNNFMVTGDSPDNNEHQTYSEYIAEEISSLTDDEVATTKIYINAYPRYSTCDKMMETFNQGTLYGTYLGHSQAVSLSSDESLWRKNFALKLKNTRFPFMSFGGCTVTALDCGERGSSETMLFNKSGIIGGVMSSRTAYSYYNYLLLSYINQALMLQDGNAATSTKRLSRPRTIGETYALAKNNLQVSSSNELVYHLVCDPAITIPVATHHINLTLSDASISPKSKITISGIVTDESGIALTDFNGTIVAKLFAPPIVKKTYGHHSEAVDITYDETILTTTSTDVKEGKFETTILLPPNVEPSSGTASIRVAAYSPELRIGASGIASIEIGENNTDKSITDTNAPIIDYIYLNSPDFCDGDATIKDFIFYAQVSDDYGISTTSNSFTNNLYLTLDGKDAIFYTSQYCNSTNNNKQINLSIPMTNISVGQHTLTLHVADIMGNTTTRSISFYVTDKNIRASLIVKETPIRDIATFELQLDDTENLTNTTLYITDAIGQHVKSITMTDSKYQWDLNDETGVRVPQGIYYAHCKLSSGHTINGHTTVVKMTILKAKE